MALADAYFRTLLRGGWKGILFNDSETVFRPPWPNVWVIQPNLAPSDLEARCIAKPMWMSDVGRLYPEMGFGPLPCEGIPTISFRGNDGGLRGWGSLGGSLRRLLRSLAYRRDVAGRARMTDRACLLRQVLRWRGVNLRIALSEGSWVGFRMATGEGGAASEVEESHRRYCSDLAESAYHLCVRGAANASFRLYEVMSAGRIPVLINTRCVLPLDRLVDWRRLCVWIEEDEASRGDVILLSRHAASSGESFRVWQEEVRRAWEEHLSPSGYFQCFTTEIGDG